MERTLAIGDGEIRHRLRDRKVKKLMLWREGDDDDEPGGSQRSHGVESALPSARIHVELSVATLFWRREAREYVSKT